MATITVLSLNMQGIAASKIAEAICKIQPDLVALQEVPATQTFYADLQHGLQGSAAAYGSTGPIREYPHPPPVIGKSFLDAQGSMKQIFVLYKTTTLQLHQRLSLVNFLNDMHIDRPKTVAEARMQGFAARPPAYCRFLTTQGYKVGMFVWHAPTRVDAAHIASLDHFDESSALNEAMMRNNLTILAGDFNNDNLTNYFSDFQFGIQHRFDYILADQATSHTDLLNGPHKKLLDELCTKSQDHFAMAASFTY